MAYGRIVIIVIRLVLTHFRIQQTSPHKRFTVSRNDWLLEARRLHHWPTIVVCVISFTAQRGRDCGNSSGLDLQPLCVSSCPAIGRSLSVILSCNIRILFVTSACHWIASSQLFNAIASTCYTYSVLSFPPATSPVRNWSGRCSSPSLAVAQCQLSPLPRPSPFGAFPLLFTQATDKSSSGACESGVSF